MAKGVSAKTLAVLLDMDERVVRRLASEGIIVRAGRNQYLLAPSVRNYVRHLREVAAGRQAKEFNAVDENARLKIAQRRNLPHYSLTLPFNCFQFLRCGFNPLAHAPFDKSRHGSFSGTIARKA
jgi:hypothetical protein